MSAYLDPMSNFKSIDPATGEAVWEGAAATPAQVQAVAAKYFGDDQLTVATLLPQPLDSPRRRAQPAPGASRH